MTWQDVALRIAAFITIVILVMILAKLATGQGDVILGVAIGLFGAVIKDVVVLVVGNGSKEKEE